jgi:hypothetical protein
MLSQVLMRTISRQTDKISVLQKARFYLTAAAEKVNWHRARKLLPLVLGSFLVIYGLSHSGSRNLVGIGAALLFLTAGFTIFVKGRIQLSDFWN